MPAIEKIPAFNGLVKKIQEEILKGNRGRKSWLKKMLPWKIGKYVNKNLFEQKIQNVIRSRTG